MGSGHLAMANLDDAAGAFAVVGDCGGGRHWDRRWCAALRGSGRGDVPLACVWGEEVLAAANDFAVE